MATRIQLLTLVFLCLCIGQMTSTSLAAPAAHIASSAHNEQQDLIETQSSLDGIKTMAPKQSANTVKLMRGLTSFMNQLNPAPFFVPPQTHKLVDQQSKAASSGDTGKQQVKGQAGGGSSQLPSADLAAIVNGDSSGDVLLIKGPNRLTRPIGGSLRWGRRRRR